MFAVQNVAREQTTAALSTTEALEKILPTPSRTFGSGQNPNDLNLNDWHTDCLQPSSVESG
jgi:hypothetical protein